VPAIGRETLQALQTGTSASIMTLISLCLLPLLQPVVDVVNWQRVAVFANQRDAGHYADAEWTAAFKTFGHTYAREVPLMALFIVLFGVLAGLTSVGASEGGATQAFLASLVGQENSVATAVVSLLMLGFLALAVATIGSLFCAAIGIVGTDIVPMLRPRSISNADAAGGKEAGGRLLAALLIGVLVLATFMLADMGSEHSLGIAGLLGAMLAFSSVQMALVPLALAPLLSGSGRSANVTPAWAAAVLAIGAAIGIGITIAGLAFGQAAALPFAVPAAFAATALVFLIAVLASRKNAAAPSGGSASN
jgi:hypothetical protein